VVVIGSGATAATLIPAIADECGSLTMLQRSPTYFIPARNANELADQLRELDVDPAWIHEIVRRKILHDQDAFTRRSFEEPEVVKEELLAGVRAFLPEETVQAHFLPKYRPWRQRIAFVPDGDLFQAAAAGKAQVVTDEIERFDATGIQLKSGRHLDADVIITATGFNLSVLGDIAFTVDNQPVDFSQTVTWRGMMFTGVPNMVWVFGYFRASWTLRVDILGDFVCRLLNTMKAKGVKKVAPQLRPEDEGMALEPWIDPENFNPGYLMRSMHLMPRRGDKPEWQHTQDYWAERQELPKVDFEAEGLVFG
jgi:cation diffusion facilitator CzcD-associated flavoprotein CzcO